MIGRSTVNAAKKVLLNLRADISDPQYVPPGHYYSPLPNSADLERAIHANGEPLGVDLRPDHQIELARQLDLALPANNRWVDGNVWFGASDAAVLRAMIRRVRPRSFVEIGSGYSTAIALDTIDDFDLETSVLCVDPYADRLRSVLRPADSARVTIREEQVQDIPPADLAALVAPGDIFFIDSTHVAKPGSDVLHLFLHTLPLLPDGVHVQIHDIFWPFEYPDSWLRQGRAWTEIYLLHALLSDSARWQIDFFSDWYWTEHREAVPAPLRSSRPGSIWLSTVD